jgi:hypothetical protein
MRFISHRGFINGPHNGAENSPSLIDEALRADFDVEVDVWAYGSNDTLWLGHDRPIYQVGRSWFVDRYPRLLIHCKNRNALVAFQDRKHYHIFAHEQDDYAFTSQGIIICYPGVPTVPSSIMMTPEAANCGVSYNHMKNLWGVCSDFITSIKRTYEDGQSFGNG